jgi:tetratricopeptide (TPR) repeat protein
MDHSVMDSNEPETLHRLETSSPNKGPLRRQLFALLDKRIFVHRDLGEEADRIINCLRTGRDATVGEDPVDMLYYLGCCLQLCFDTRGEDADLEAAITTYRQVIELTPESHSELPPRLSKLALSLESRFSRFGEDADLEEALAGYRRAIGLMPDNHSDRLSLLNNFANSLRSCFDRFGEDADLEEAVITYRQTIKLTSEWDSNLPSRLNNLAGSLTSRFTRFGEDADLEEAITTYRRAIKLTPVSDGNFPVRLNNLANSLRSRFTRFGEDADLEEAITTFRRVIKLSPRSRIHPICLNNLALSLNTRFIRFGEDADLEEAVTIYRQVLKLTPDNHRDLPMRLHNLAGTLRSRFVRFGEDADLEEGIRSYRRAIELTPDGHSNLLMILGNLAETLELRFARFRKESDLEEAIKNYRQIVELTPDGHANLPALLNSLADAVHTRFRCFGEDADLEEAVSTFRWTIKLTPDGHISLPSGLSGLAGSLVSRFARFSEDADLEEAIAYYRQAVKLTPDNHENLPTQLNNLAMALSSRFTRFGEDTDLEEALTNYRRAIELTPEDHRDLPLRLTNLALSLQARFVRFGQISDLEEAIADHRRVIELTPDGDCDVPSLLSELAAVLALRFSRFKEDGDLAEAIGLYKNGSALTVGSVKGIFDCATGLAKLAHANNRPSDALDGYSVAISLLSQMSWLGQSSTSRERALTLQPANFASDAAACAITLGLLDKAVELLDHGRSVFWSQVMDSETDLADLRACSPTLAARFEELTRALDATTFQDSLIGSPVSQVQSSADPQLERRRLLTTEMEILLERTREHSNLHNFMKPPPFPELQLSASAGPVILLNASSYRCDALIITVDSPPQLVPLPEISLDDVARIAQDFRGDRDSRDFRSRLEQHLPFVWRDMVQPVLLALGYNEMPASANSKPRVWWCPTGPFSFIPIHAAGPYTKSGGPDLTKRVLSSYTPTLRALSRARSQHRTSEKCRVLLVAQPNTPGQPPLPGVSEEVKVIYEAVSSKYGASEVSMLVGHDAMKDVVLSELKDATCAHFACHGYQEQTGGALNSALFVHDGPLLLSTIASNRLSKADFAFLSACSTASGSDQLPDEAMHIAAGMLIAGFRSVVATMWTISDGTGPRLAEKVYGHLLRNESDAFDSTEAAFALNEGVQILRKAKYPTSDWVPFIHIGV